MNELKPIELDCNLGRDINGVAHRVPWKAYDIDEVDAVIAEKDAEIARLDDLAHAHNIELLRKENLITELKRALWLARAERAMMTLVEEFLGDVFKQYQVPFAKTTDTMVVG